MWFSNRGRQPGQPGVAAGGPRARHEADPRARAASQPGALHIYISKYLLTGVSISTYLLSVVSTYLLAVVSTYLLTVVPISTYLLTLVSIYLLQLTPDSPDYTDGKLVAVTLTELQVGRLHCTGCWVMARCCRRGYPSSTGRTSCSEDSRSWTISWTPV